VITSPDLPSTLYSSLLEHARNLHPCEQAVKENSLIFHPSVTSRVKRLIDILGALIGLVVTALIAIPVAIAVQLDRKSVV